MTADYYVIRAKRFALGFTQKQLAEASGLGLSTILKAERGGSISATSNGKIMKALGIN